MMKPERKRLEELNLSDPLDILTPEERRRLERDLAEIARVRRQAFNGIDQIYLD